MLAARPKTLPAAVAPVLVASAVAAGEGHFAPLPAAVALVCALLIQIATNFANDYFDFVKGADTHERVGPVRVVAAGIIAPRTVRNAMIGVLALTFVLGLFLVWIGGWPILAIGVASIFCAVIYTAGPFPLAYNGLGDIFVFVFFGIAAVTGTHYVQALTWSADALVAALPMGAISTAILVVNNYRDIDTDRGAAKRTLAVRMGRPATRIEYVALLAVAYLVPVAQVLAGGLARLPLLLTLGSLPLAVPLVRTIYTVTDGPRLNAALGGTGRLLALFAILYSLGHLL